MENNDNKEPTLFNGSEPQQEPPKPQGKPDNGELSKMRFEAMQRRERAEEQWVFEQIQELRELREQLEGTGQYFLLPTVALTKRAEAYYTQYAEDITKLFANTGVDDETTRGILQDYIGTLTGLFNVKLPLSKQAELLGKIRPWRVFLTERYGLNLLFFIYMNNVRAAREYIDYFKLADGHLTKVTAHLDENGKIVEEREQIEMTVEEQKRDFLNTKINRIKSGTVPMYAAGYRWINNNKADESGELFSIVEPSDFSGIEPELVNQYYAYVDGYSGVDYYVSYYYIAKYALKATPEELKEIDFPPLFKDFESASEYAERVGAILYRNAQSTAEKVERLLAAETVEETEKAKQELTEPSEPQGTIRVPETFALLGSRDVWASVDGTPKMTQGILPIKAFITDYMTRNHLTEQVTPRTVEKVIEGVNLLQNLYNVKPVGGQYTFETNISEFAELIGYKDANQEQKLEIMRALQVLDGLYLAVWRSNGLEALRVFTIQRIGLTGELAGKLTLNVYADVMKGRPNLISYRDFNDMRKNAKGQAEHHFRNQIIAKGQKEENALLNEVFGYETLLEEIAQSGGTAEDIAKAKRNIEKHKSRDKRRLAKWFEEYKQRGWLVWYTYTRNPKGEYIYKWRRGNIPQEQGTKPVEEPEEQ